MIQEWVLLSLNGTGEVVVKRVHCQTIEQASAKVKVLFPDTWFAIRVVRGLTFRTFEDFEQNRHHYKDIKDCRTCPYADSKHKCKLTENKNDCPTSGMPTWCPNDYLRLAM